MISVLSFTRNRRIPLNLRRLVGEWFIRKSDRKFELDVGSIFRGRLDNYLEWMVFVTGQYFEFPYINLIRKIHQGGVALDVGANTGNHALAFSEFFDRVYALEPFPVVYDRLKARREISSRIHPFRLALSDKAGVLSFETPGTDNLGIGRITPDGSTQVKAILGDDFAAAEIGSSIDFVKIDVEGHEIPVIRGLANTLEKDSPTVMFEASNEVVRSRESLRACFSLFPDDYVFHRLGGQSTWPVQQDVARVIPMDRQEPNPRRRSCDLICFSREKIPPQLWGRAE